MEVFGGGASLLFNRPQQSWWKCITTLILRSVEFFQRPPSTRRRIHMRWSNGSGLLVYSRELYNCEYASDMGISIGSRLDTSIPMVRCRITSSFSGSRSAEGMEFKQSYQTRPAQLRNRVANICPAVIQRVCRDVHIENETWQAVLDRYDSAGHIFLSRPAVCPSDTESRRVTNTRLDDDGASPA